MNVTNIHRLNSLMQDRQEGRINMQGIALTNLLHRIIREYGKYDGVDYSVNLPEIEMVDRRLLLSHILDSEDYEWSVMTDRRTSAVFEDEAEHIQKIIDSECSEVYREDMEERGMYCARYSDNNEQYYARR